MAVVMEKKNDYVAEFEAFERENDGWFMPMRKAAIARFAELGFPTTQHEEWRYTNVAPIVKTPFVRPARPAEVSLDALRPYLFGGEEVARMVFVDGFYSPELSTRGHVPANVKLLSLAALLESDAPEVKAHLARHARLDDDKLFNAFTALNTAFVQDGAYLHVPRGVNVEHPVHLIYVSTGGSEPAVSYARNLIVAEESSQVSLIESYVGLEDNVYLTNTVTELAAAENAVVYHCKLNRESEQAYHLSSFHLQQARSSTVQSCSVILGAALTRNDINAVLAGEGADCDLDGLYILNGRQHADNHLRVEHASPNCNSREFYRGILDGESRGVFTGRIFVHKIAQKTDAKQTNRNLLLSRDALVDTKPQLEIFADDVKCTHGATIGQIEEQSLFYLRARGIPEDKARGLLVYAFASESIHRIHSKEVQHQLEHLLFERMQPGEVLEEAV